jgi:Rho termination factor, N-terminal domain
MPQGNERTKEQLYRQAKQLGIKGRSKMNKGQLKAAIERRR